MTTAGKCAVACAWMLYVGSLVPFPARADATAVVDPDTVLVDHFDGWGTSLCWWANVIGGLPNREEYADRLFGELGVNLVRYNIGGGEDPANPQWPTEYRARMDGFQPTPGDWEWDADANQRWMLRAAVERGATQIEMFANSPPYWMTVSGSVTGSGSGSDDNLQIGKESAFARYLSDVARGVSAMEGVRIDTLTPMNESSATWWTYGGRQEGCHISRAQQERLLVLLRASLNARGLPIRLSAAEEFSPSQTVDSITAYAASTLDHLAHLSTHTYSVNAATALRALAMAVDRPARVSEYGDGDGSGLTLARRIIHDLTVMHAQAWTYWQLVDNAGGWGMLKNNLTGSSTSYTINQKFYVFSQFSQFIRPGFALIESGEANTVAGYDPIGHRLVMVTVNASETAWTLTGDLGGFSESGSEVTRHRTSGAEQLARLAPVIVTDQQFTSVIEANSVTTHVIDDVTVARSLPPVVAGVAAARAGGAIAVSWHPTPGAESYVVRRSTQAGGPWRVAARGRRTSLFLDTAVLSDTPYFYTVAAVNLAGEGPPSAATIHAAPLAPSDAPAGLTTYAGGAGVGVWWNPVAGAAGYRIRRGEVSGGPYTWIGSAVGETHFTDRTVSAGSTFHYVVAATNALGEGPASSESSVSLPAFRRLSEDAQVRADAHADQNYGSSSSVEVELDEGAPSDTREVFVKINVAGLSEISSARLRLFPISVGSEAHTTMHEVEWIQDDSWREQTITWNTKPAGSGIIVSHLAGLRNGRIEEIDLTGLVRTEAAGDQVLSLRIRSITSGGNRWVLYTSSESSFRESRPGLVYSLQAPTAPSGLTTTVEQDGIVLSWVPVTGAAGYRISRGMEQGSMVTLTNDYPGTHYLDTTVTNGSVYHYAVQAQSPVGDSGYSAETSAEAGLAAHYALAGDAGDSGGHYDGMPVGASYEAAGVTGRGAVFDGSDDYLYLPRSISDDFTISCWVKTTASGGSGPWWNGLGLVDGEVAGSRADFGLALVGNLPAFGVGAPDTTLAAATPINDGRWHHVAATRESGSGEMRIFVDGILEGTTVGPTGSRTGPPTLRVGSLQAGYGFLPGAVDEVRLYHYVLNAPAITGLAQFPNGPLRFTRIQASGDPWVFAGEGGVPTHEYHILTSTNLVELPGLWAPVATHVYGPNGTFHFTNIVEQVGPTRFYRVQDP